VARQVVTKMPAARRGQQLARLLAMIVGRSLTSEGEQLSHDQAVGVAEGDDLGPERIVVHIPGDAAPSQRLLQRIKLRPAGDPDREMIEPDPPLAELVARRGSPGRP
jgi:hypothetical protein